MPVRMADVHLAYAPRLVHRRHGDLQTLLEATLVDDVDVVHPDRHPDALVIVVAPGGRERALPAPALTVQAEKNLAFARADGPEGRGIAPLETLRPAELLESGDAFREVRDVQDRRDGLGDHGMLRTVHEPCLGRYRIA
jgi:hypothetical protein